MRGPPAGSADPAPARDLPAALCRGLSHFFTDIDDTLTSDGMMPAASYEALWDLASAGIRTVAVTGRPAGWCDHIARMWPVDAVVGENGAFYFMYDRQARKLIKRLVMPEDRRRTRRFAPAMQRLRIDARRSFRRSLQPGGAIDLEFRASVERSPPVVALCDISGSMSEYSRLFLHFLHALGETRRVSTFLFGTRLTNVTRAMRASDPDDALARCTALAVDWSGGTRIGEALARFNRKWSRRVLGQGAIVLLFTDGLEREGVDQLATEMERLRKSSRRLIWINPLLRFGGFAAKAQGVRAMLPHVDAFRPIHNLASMADLCNALANGRDDARDPKTWLREDAA